IEVAGHTDSTGTDSYNNALSKSRAAAVALYLRNKGIGSERLTVKGYGESTPIADNSTKQGRALNRRVVLKILNQD
ncbi:MAG: OmpA family protein, partial [Gammaproteobacteria bacterium]|nr:OmpA family protein [Gammaproteobacteria bacterium]